MRIRGGCASAKFHRGHRVGRPGLKASLPAPPRRERACVWRRRLTRPSRDERAKGEYERQETFWRSEGVGVVYGRRRGWQATAARKVRAAFHGRACGGRFGRFFGAGRRSSVWQRSRPRQRPCQQQLRPVRSTTTTCSCSPDRAQPTACPSALFPSLCSEGRVEGAGADPPTLLPAVAPSPQHALRLARTVPAPPPVVVLDHRRAGPDDAAAPAFALHVRPAVSPARPGRARAPLDGRRPRRSWCGPAARASPGAAVARPRARGPARGGPVPQTSERPRDGRHRHEPRLWARRKERPAGQGQEGACPGLASAARRRGICAPLPRLSPPSPSPE